MNKIVFYNNSNNDIIVIPKDHYHQFFFLLSQFTKYILKCKIIFYLMSLLNLFFQNIFNKSNILSIYIIIHTNYGNIKHNIMTSHIMPIKNP